MDKSKLRFKGKNINGEFVPNEPVAWQIHKKSFGDEEVSVTMKKWRNYKVRSNQENRYYHGVVVKILADELGYTSDQMHEAIKYQFLAEPSEIIRERKTKEGTEKYKKTLIVPGSTAVLSTTDFETLMSKIRTWASQELSIYIPLPNEVPFEY